MVTQWKEQFSTRRCVFVVFGLALLFVGYGVSLFVHSPLVSDKITDNCTTNLTWINPEPGCEVFEEKLSELRRVKEQLRRRIDQAVQENQSTKIAIFARDLTTNRYVGIHESELFNMASLLKVPLAMSFYHLAMTKPEILSQEIVYDGSLDGLYTAQTYQPRERLAQGNMYTIKELIRHSLIFSDNVAAKLLIDAVPKEYLFDVFDALGLTFAEDGERNDLVTAGSYAALFRNLYNSSLLSREYSNEVLNILTQATVDIGAKTVLPKDVTIASKFGEREIVDSQTQKILSHQLHECGIVYAKNGAEPYTFCILTEGVDFHLQEKVIADLSRILYSNIAE